MLEVEGLGEYDGLGGVRGTALEVRAPDPTSRLLVYKIRTTFSSENSP